MKILTALMVLIGLFLSRISCAQGIRDSLFVLQQVDVAAPYFFKKETAGMKETRMDSLVLDEKIHLTLSELLSENSSVFIKSHGRGALATASFRGTAASHTQVAWNGIHINSPMTGMVDFSLIPVYIIDELSLKHGAASISGQSGGLGGSININNTVDWNNTLSARYVQGIGSYSTYDEFVMVGMGNKQVQSKTRLYHNHSANDYTFVNRGIGNIDPATGVISHPTDTNHLANYTRYGLLQELYWRPVEQSIVAVKWWSQWADRTIPRATSFEGPDNSNLNNQTDHDHKLVTDWNYYGSKGKWMLRSGYSGKNLDYTLRNFVPGLGLLPAIYSESQQRSFLNQVSYSFERTPAWSVEARLDGNRHGVVTRDSVQKTGYEVNRCEYSAFVAFRKGLANRVNFNIMLRQEWIEHARLPLIPYLGMDVRMIKGVDWIVKGHIARNYHYPSLNDLYWQPGGNPDLLPEDGVSFEVGTEYLSSIGHHHLKTEVTFYRNDIDNWVIWIPSFKGYWEPLNVKNVVSKGVEINLRLKGHLGSLNYSLLGSYAYTRSINYGDPLVWGDDSYGKQLVYVPLYSGNLMVQLAYKDISLGWQHNAYSERFTTSSNDVSRRDWLYPYYMNDLSAGYDFRVSKWDLSTRLKIYNLFDETYHSILYRPMPGRNYHLLLMLKI